MVNLKFHFPIFDSWSIVLLFVFACGWVCLKHSTFTYPKIIRTIPIFPPGQPRCTKRIQMFLGSKPCTRIFTESILSSKTNTPNTTSVGSMPFSTTWTTTKFKSNPHRNVEVVLPFGIIAVLKSISLPMALKSKSASKPTSIATTDLLPIPKFYFVVPNQEGFIRQPMVVGIGAMLRQVSWLVGYQPLKFLLSIRILFSSLPPMTFGNPSMVVPLGPSRVNRLFNPRIFQPAKLFFIPIIPICSLQPPIKVCFNPSIWVWRGLRNCPMNAWQSTFNPLILMWFTRCILNLLSASASSTRVTMAEILLSCMTTVGFKRIPAIPTWNCWVVTWLLQRQTPTAFTFCSPDTAPMMPV